MWIPRGATAWAVTSNLGALVYTVKFNLKNGLMLITCSAQSGWLIGHRTNLLMGQIFFLQVNININTQTSISLHYSKKNYTILVLGEVHGYVDLSFVGVKYFFVFLSFFFSFYFLLGSWLFLFIFYFTWDGIINFLRLHINLEIRCDLWIPTQQWAGWWTLGLQQTIMSGLSKACGPAG